MSAMLVKFRKLRDLISSTSTYCRDNPWALDRGGCICDPCHKDAVVWSITGAIRKVNAPHSAQHATVVEMMRFFCDTNKIAFISEWADRVIHPQVLSAVDKCIAKLESGA